MISWQAGRPNTLEVTDLKDAGTLRPLTNATVSGAIFEMQRGSLLWSGTLTAYKGSPGAGLVVSGVHSATATLLAVSGGDDEGTLLEGDLLVLGALAGIYRVQQGIVLSSSGAGTVKVTEYGDQPGLIQSTAGGEAITVQANRYRVVVPVSAGLAARNQVRVVVTATQAGATGRFEALVTPG